MLLRVFHWLFGCVKFQIYGDAARFLNLAAKSGLLLWGFARSEAGAFACCRPGDYRRLRPIARRCRVTLRCRERRGLAFELKRARQRPGLMIGTAVGVAVFWLLSGFVWGVEVSGTETVSERTVLRAAAENGVFVGARRSGVSGRLAAHGILSEVSGLSWVAVNTNGCFAEVIVREGERTPEVTDDSKLTNLVAARAGTVVAIEAERGRPEVTLGETVQAGQLLISGSYQEEKDPWSSSPNAPYEQLGAARGRVIAETYREFAVQVPAEKRIQRLTGECQTNRTLVILGLRLPLGLNDTPAQTARSYTKRRQVTALGVKLPITLEETVFAFTEEDVRVLSQEEQQTEALRRLRAAQRAVLPQGGRVKSEELTVVCGEGVCVLSAQCRCLEEIGRMESVLAE